MWGLVTGIREVRLIFKNSCKYLTIYFHIGPLIIQDPSDGHYHLIGVTSFGSLRGCAVEGIPTVFTRVSSFRDWILLNMAEP
jgi:hypothetical protein